MQLHDGYKLVVIGDSITDCDRVRPVGEGSANKLGNGYVALLHALLQTEHPATLIRLVNMGVSGNTVRDLKRRWQDDVIQLQPDGVIICIGINDVWRKFDAPWMPEDAVYAEEYEATLRHLVYDTLAWQVDVMLLTPFYVEPNEQDPMRAEMDRYGAIVKQIGAENKIKVIDIQAVMNEMLEHLYPSVIAGDRVHPGTTGHLAIAKAIFKQLIL
ncbi:SGNH/GDSL hydrolase family protein [Paenibacillus sp. ACRRX]|uniref:SGNH/GDSL hydrolase family protein n=1 Tax=Paenibacillus sp. ACRRX TaxID=2918206 RepID=UPI001EF62B35|nr:SGNH/GDSL hydrolase family protein [Paenibacillus sp. ACRRX]MCG7408855.1 SGNH/GDSL hydrolase family protein [Paenibacillus sp. ACRRX]